MALKGQRIAASPGSRRPSDRNTEHLLKCKDRWPEAGVPSAADHRQKPYQVSQKLNPQQR
jgi:hypothetical protein